MHRITFALKSFALLGIIASLNACGSTQTYAPPAAPVVAVAPAPCIAPVALSGSGVLNSVLLNQYYSCLNARMTYWNGAYNTQGYNVAQAEADYQAYATLNALTATLSWYRPPAVVVPVYTPRVVTPIVVPSVRVAQPNGVVVPVVTRTIPATAVRTQFPAQVKSYQNSGVPVVKPVQPVAPVVRPVQPAVPVKPITGVQSGQRTIQQPTAAPAAPVVRQQPAPTVVRPQPAFNSGRRR